MAIPYTKQTWTDGVSALSAARMGVIEDGILGVSFAPAVRAWAGAATNCTTAVFTIMALNSEDFDQANNTADTMHDNLTNNSRLTCRYAGVYDIRGNIQWPSSPAQTDLQIYLNNTTVIQWDTTVADRRRVSTSTHYKLAVNDFVELRVQQVSGGTLACTTLSFSMVRVG
jgi:hypothetical protein